VGLRGSVADAGRLAVSSSSIEFGESLTSQQLTITNTGGASLSWSASSASSWISLSPMKGTVDPDAEQFVTVTVSREGQETDFLGSIEIDSDGGAASVSVSALFPAAPLLSVSPAALTFGAATNRQTLTLQNTGSIALDWTVTSGDSWLVPLTPFGAVLPGESRTIFVEVRRDELTVGTHQSALTFSGGASDVSVTATVSVQEAPDLGLTGSIEVGEDPGFVLQIANLGTGTLNWVARETSDWLVIDVTEGSAGALGSTVTATIDREGLAADDYSTTVFITSDGGNGEVQVSMTVPLPVVRFLSGPGPEETALEDSATWELAADKIFGEVEYSTRMDGGSWSDWSADPVFGYGGLEESSLFGSHEIEGRVRTAAGQSNPQMRSFEVDALQGPAIRITPMRMQTSPGEDMTVSVVLEEVIGVLGGRVVVTFDEAIEVSDASWVEDLLDGATAISPSITVERGRVELGFAAAGLAGGISGTGALLRLTLSANSSSAIEIGSESTLRDLSNQDIPIRVRDGQILVE